jgi:hypothetical protein
MRFHRRRHTGEHLAGYLFVTSFERSDSGVCSLEFGVSVAGCKRRGPLLRSKKIA